MFALRDYSLGASGVFSLVGGRLRGVCLHVPSSWERPIDCSSSRSERRGYEGNYLLRSFSSFCLHM